MKRSREEEPAVTTNTSCTDQSNTSSDPLLETNLKKQVTSNISSELSSYFSLGCNYMDGVNGVEKDYLKAFELFSKGVEEGCLRSIHKIGYFYSKGLGVEQDYDKAVQFYMKSAEGGFVASYANLGLYFEQGKGVQQDHVKAFEWTLKAAEKGDTTAQFNVGVFFEEGKGCQQDDVKAFEWTLKAAENDNTDAQFNIGRCYSKGTGVEQDHVKAFEWYLKAAEKGDTDAQFVIGCIYRKGAGVEQDHVKAFEWYFKAAEKGCARAQLNIGVCFDDGIGVEQDHVKAFEWYFKAAEKGCKDAQFNLGCCYKKGEGVEMDLKLALYWLSKVVNDIDFEFIEPYDEFGIEPFKTCDVNNLTTNENEIPLIEQVIIRLEEKDFTISNNFSSSKYLSTMMNSHWRDFNQKYENQTILDLRSIENDIFQEETNHIQIFQLYINYLTSNLLPTDFNLKLKVIELARYLGDDECILKIVRESSVLARFYILLKFELIDPINIAVASCYATEPSLNIEDLSGNALELLLAQSQLSSPAKKEIFALFEKKFNNFPKSITFSKLNIYFSD